jgi:Ca-activated chloride channel family protein
MGGGHAAESISFDFIWESALMEWGGMTLLAALGWPIDGFAHPEWLWGVLAWPLVWLFYRLLQRNRRVQDDLSALQAQSRFVFRHPLIHLQAEQEHIEHPRSKRPFDMFRFGLQWLRGAILIGVLLALAEPYRLQPPEPQPQQKTVRDVVFVIESSASFMLNDYQLNGQAATRMEVVKQVLDRFIGGLEGNRFGLTIYAEQAYTLMPLSGDQTAARLNLKRLKPYLAGRTDEALGEGLGLALRQTEQGMQGDDQQTLKRVVVLISDGQAQPSRIDVAEALEYAQTMAVPIYTIGVGASSADADRRSYSGLLYQPLEAASLQRIAAQTGGLYYQIGGGEDLQRVLQEIDRAAGTPYEAPPGTPEKRLLYDGPLAVSLVAMLAYLLLSRLVYVRWQVRQTVAEAAQEEG